MMLKKKKLCGDMTPNFEFTKSIYPIFLDLHPYSGISVNWVIFLFLSPILLLFIDFDIVFNLSSRDNCLNIFLLMLLHAFL